jgi:hypothetical protein
MIFYSKIILGLLLAVFLFLPIGSCEKKPINEPSEPIQRVTTQAKSSDEKANPIRKTEKYYLVLIKELSFKNQSDWIPLSAFLWPVPFLFLKNKVARTGRNRIIANIIELLLICCSGYFIYFVVFFFWYDPTIWGYLAAILISAYALLHLVEIFRLLKNRKNRPAIDSK